MESLVDTSHSQFWVNKRVLVTGHTGFKGGWLTLWLKKLRANVTAIGLDPNTNPNLFELADVAKGVNSHICDICDAATIANIAREAQPEIVLHLAAQPLVRASYREPLRTFNSNVIGTANLLDALRNLESTRVAVMITTDKVYRNREWPYPYREEDALGGHDPYSASKAASEFIIASYRDAFLAPKGVAVASARAGNVIGGGDWSQDRLIPDAIRAWESGQPLEIRCPQAIRPWQHVLEPLGGYLTLAEKLWQQPELAGAYNFGPQTNEAATVQTVIELARTANGGGKVRYGDCTDGPHETSWLALETAKTTRTLGITPKWGLEQTVNRTITWYKAQQKGADARNLCEAEINDYEAQV